MTNYKAVHENLKKEMIIAASNKWKNVIAIPYDVATVRGLNNPKRIFKVGQDGVPDIIVIGPNRETLWIDTKAGASGLNENQKVFKKCVEMITGKPSVFAARTVKEFLKIVEINLSTSLIER